MLAEARKNCLGSEPELPLKSFGLVALGGGGGGGGSPVFRQCENLPPALALSCHKNSVHCVSKETLRVPMLQCFFRSNML